MSLNIIIDADVQSATQKIGKFVYTMKQDFKEVEKTVRRTSTTVKESTDKMAEAANSFGKSSRNSLTALSLTLQDLPFGFIGIQNNLPGIIQGFGQMSAEAKTGASVMTQLKTALMGPAGLFLAFSAVTSIVTMLTLKYGSLGAAFDAIFGKTNKLNIKIKELSDSYIEFNKNLKTSEDITGQESSSVTGTIAKIESLTKVILSQTKSYNERNAALNTLKELDKERFGNLDLETLKLNTLTDAVNNYTNSLIAAAITKGFEEEISRTSVEISKQVSILKDLDEAKKTAAAAPQRIVGKSELIDRTEIIKTESAYNKQLAVVKELTKRKDELTTEIRKSIEAQIALKAPVDAATAALEKQKKAEKESKVKIGTIIDSGELGPGRLVDTLEAFQAYVRGNINIQKNSIDKILTARLDYRRKELEENFLLPKKIDKNAGPLNKNPLIEYQFGQITAIIDALKQEAKFIDDAFRAPLENLFVDFLQKGKLSFEDFTKSVMRNITQLVAKLAASKLFEALANLIPQIAGTLVPGGTGLLELTNVLGRGRNIFGAANLGGIGGGGMNLNGQVDFVQRGTDLVGVMNRTNAQIQRIG
jgi:DNA-binding ferritin-like protein